MLLALILFFVGISNHLAHVLLGWFLIGISYIIEYIILYKFKYRASLVAISSLLMIVFMTQSRALFYNIMLSENFTLYKRGIITNVENDGDKIYYSSNNNNVIYILQNEIQDATIINNALYDHEIGDSVIIFQNKYIPLINLPLPLNKASESVKNKK